LVVEQQMLVAALKPAQCSACAVAHFNTAPGLGALAAGKPSDRHALAGALSAELAEPKALNRV
jgi:hypothetical protein